MQPSEDELLRMFRLYADGQRRIRDVDLAEVFGMDVRDLRKEIEENMADLERFGPVACSEGAERCRVKQGGMGK